MKRRKKKGTYSIFQRESQAYYVSYGEESQDEQLTTASEVSMSSSPDSVIVLDDDEVAVVVLDSDESPGTPELNEESQENNATQDPLYHFLNLLVNSNFSQLVTDFMEKFLPDECQRKPNVTKLLYKIYMENPTSRRCPILNFQSLYIQQFLVSEWETSQLKKYNIMACRVDLSKGNVIFSLEKRIYRRFREAYPISKKVLKFIEPTTLTSIVLEYLCHILRNVNAIFRQPKQLSGIVARERDVEALVDKLFALLDEFAENMKNHPEPGLENKTLDLLENASRSPEDDQENATAGERIELPENATNSSEPGEENRTLELDQNIGIVGERIELPENATNRSQPCPEVQRRYRPPPQRLKILKADLKNPKRQCSREEISSKLLMEGRLEIDVQMQTPLGLRIISIHGDDIQRFFNIPPEIWKKTTNILKIIEAERKVGNLTANSKLLIAFADSWSKKLKLLRNTQLKGQELPYHRYYTIHEWDENSDNLIELQK